MKHYRVSLTLAERDFLKQQINEGKYRNTKLRRAQILLGADESEGGLSMRDTDIHHAYGASLSAIERTRLRFVEEGFDIALHGKERPYNGKRIVDGRLESQIIALRCSDVPQGANSWTLRLLADRVVELGYTDQISYNTVNNVLKKHQLSLGE